VRALTRMRSKRVAWSTLTKSASQFLRSSPEAAVVGAELLLAPESSAPALAAAAAAWTCLLQYSITLDRIFELTLGSGMPLSAQSSSIMWRMVCDSIATASSTSNSSPSELLRVIIFFSPSAAMEVGGSGILDRPLRRNEFRKGGLGIGTSGGGLGRLLYSIYERIFDASAAVRWRVFALLSQTVRIGSICSRNRIENLPFIFTPFFIHHLSFPTITVLMQTR
jgi:hypothetical protein